MKRNSAETLLNSQELAILLTLADALILTSYRPDTVAIALHPPRWLRRSVAKKIGGGAQKVLPSTPLLRATTKHLVAVARRFLTAKSWSRKKIARDAREYLALRTKQHASGCELLAIQAFAEILGSKYKSYRPKSIPRRSGDIRNARPGNDGVYMSHASRDW